MKFQITFKSNSYRIRPSLAQNKIQILIQRLRQQLLGPLLQEASEASCSHLNPCQARSYGSEVPIVLNFLTNLRPPVNHELTSD